MSASGTVTAQDPGYGRYEFTPAFNYIRNGAVPGDPSALTELVWRCIYLQPDSYVRHTPDSGAPSASGSELDVARKQS